MPYFTVYFPSATQGLLAFKKLREWRKLHEYSWSTQDRNAFLAKQKPFDEARKELKGEENEEGMSWKKLARKSARRRMINTSKFIQDQKANSVADLAAVLIEQAGQEERWQKGLQPIESAEMEDVIQLIENPELRNAKLKELREHKEELLKWRASIPKVTSRSKREKREAHEEYVLRSKPIKANSTLAWRLMQLEQAAIQLFEGKIRRWSRDEPETFASFRESGVLPSTKAREEFTVLEAGSTLGPSRTFTFKSSLGGSEEFSVDVALRDVVTTVANEVRAFLGYKHTHVTMEGVKVQWADLFDAEHAEAWPKAVQHEPMGFLKRNAQRTDSDKGKWEVPDEYGYDAEGNMIVARGWQTRLGLRLRLGAEKASSIIGLGQRVSEAELGSDPLLLADGRQPEAVVG